MVGTVVRVPIGSFFFFIDDIAPRPTVVLCRPIILYFNNTTHKSVELKYFFYPLAVVFHSCDPQLQVDENYINL